MSLALFLTNVYPIHEDRFSIPAMGIHQLSLYDLKDAPMIYDNPYLDDFYKDMRRWSFNLPELEHFYEEHLLKNQT